MLNRRSFLFLLMSMPILGATILAGDPPPVTKTLSISISDSVIHGQTTPAAALIQVQPLTEVFAIVGGVRPSFNFVPPETLAKDLQDGKTNLGVITGVELGWLGDKAKGLTPLAIAYTSDIKLKAYVLMLKNNKTPSMLELKGKKLAMPRRTQHHAQVFLHDRIARAGGQPQGFFGTSVVPPDTDAAIESVLDKEVDAVIVDGTSWEVFQERKPGRAKKLMVVAESPSFPTAAIVYKPGSIPEADVKKLRDGLYTAHQSPFCRQILNFWRISQFIPSSPEYDVLVKEIVKDYPQSIIPANFTAK